MSAKAGRPMGSSCQPGDSKPAQATEQGLDGADGDGLVMVDVVEDDSAPRC